MWYYRNVEFTDSDIGDSIGFVYCITNLVTNRKYLGRKLFTKAKTTQVKGKKKRSRVTSDWVEYFGSNKTLQDEAKLLGTDKYHKEILHLCKTLSECSYLETLEIFRQGALLGDGFYNDWCSCKIRKAHLKNIPKNP